MPMHCGQHIDESPSIGRCASSHVTKNKLPTFVNDLPGFIQGMNQSWHHYHTCISLLLPVQHRCRWSYISVGAPHEPTDCHLSTQQVFVKHLLCANIVPGPRDTWHTGHMWDLCSGSWLNSRKNYKALCIIFSESPSTIGGAIIFSILYVFGSSDTKAHSLNQWTPNTCEYAFLSVRKLRTRLCVCASIYISYILK